MKFFPSILTLAVAAISGLITQVAAQVTETPAIIGTKPNANPQGYVQGSKPGAILFSTNSGVRGTEVPLTNIRGDGLEKAIRLEERSELLANARAAFSGGNYEEAAMEFGKVADAYRIVIHIPQNFATEARFYQIECLARVGRFNAIGPLLETPAGQTIDTMLSDRYKDFTRLHKLWAIYGKQDWAALEKALAVYQEPVLDKAKLLPAPNFKTMPQSELIQIAFMRGKLFESKGEKEKALDDFLRVSSLTFANDSYLSKQALGGAMVIMSQNPVLKSENEKKKEGPLKAIQSIAYFFSKRFPETPIPPQFQEFAVRPKIDLVLAPKNEDPKEGETQPGEENKADDKGGKAKDDKGKSDDKGKGKGKTTPKGKGKGKGKGK